MTLHWRKTFLREILSLKHGYAFQGAYFKDDGRYVVATPGNFHEKGGFKFSEEKRKGYEGPVPEGYTLKMGDVIVAMTEQAEGLLGSSAVVPKSGIFLHNQRLGLVQLLDERATNLRFVYYLFNTPQVRQQIRASSSGTKVRHTSPSRIGDVAVSIPPMRVQERIAEVLSAYDDLIENNTRRIAILEEMARRIYEEWFVHFRAPGCEGLPLVESELGPIPKGWEIAPLEAMCARITDGAHHSPATVEAGRPMLSVKDMRTWGFDMAGCRAISPEDFDDLMRNDCKPRIGDVLVAKDGANLNKHTFLVDDELEAVILSSIAILRPAEKVEREFMVAALKSEDVSRRIKNSRSGAAIPRIILKDFRRLPLLMPPKSLRARFEAHVGPMHVTCRSLSKANLNLRAQRDLLLPKLISGEIEVADAAPMLEAAE